MYVRTYIHEELESREWDENDTNERDNRHAYAINIGDACRIFVSFSPDRRSERRIAFDLIFVSDTQVRS